MHLPYLKYIFGDNEFSLVPIMVGNIDKKMEQFFGEILSEYLKDDKSLFIISSDFCHWGKSFDYTPFDKSSGDVSEFVEKLDKEGINLIESQNADGFVSYLEETENTICGRHPISVFLYALQFSKLACKTELLSYTQSSKVKTIRQSSVSYAAISSKLI
jgi:AmmeMemoRadiSam system protein B